jgi:hypothetical protein
LPETFAEIGTKDVHFAERCDGLRQHFFEACAICHVTLATQRAPAEFLNLTRDLVDQVRAPRRWRDIRPGFGKANGQGTANSAGAANYNRCFARQVQLCVSHHSLALQTIRTSPFRIISKMRLNLDIRC